MYLKKIIACQGREEIEKKICVDRALASIYTWKPSIGLLGNKKGKT